MLGNFDYPGKVDNTITNAVIYRFYPMTYDTYIKTFKLTYS
jgi:eukaryotic-like serine/threonine-protein kinase